MEDIDATPKRYPGPWTVDGSSIGDIDATPKRYPDPLIGEYGGEKSSVQFPPLPTLEELAPHSPIKNEPDGESGLCAVPLEVVIQPGELRPGTEPVRLKEAETSRRMLSHQRRRTAIAMQKRRPGRLFRVFVVLVLFLGVIGGGTAYGCYFIQTNILEPLAQFFHPIKNDNYSAIDGHT